MPAMSLLRLLLLLPVPLHGHAVRGHVNGHPTAVTLATFKDLPADHVCEALKVCAVHLAVLSGVRSLTCTHLSVASDTIASPLSFVLTSVLGLRRIDISDHSFGGSGMVTLAQALAQLTELSALLLARNAVGSVAAGAPALASVLAQLAHLAQLDIAGNQLTDADVDELAPALKRCTSLSALDIGHNAISAAGWWHFVTHPLPTSIECLSIHGNDARHAAQGRNVQPAQALAVGDATSELLGACTALTRLRWTQGAHSTVPAPGLYLEMPRLHSLACYAWRGDTQFPAHLRHLELRWWADGGAHEQAMGKFGSALGKLTELQSLRVSDTLFTSSAEAMPVADAIGALQSLTELQLHWSGSLQEPEAFGQRVFSALGACTKLVHFSADIQFKEAELEDLEPSLQKALRVLTKLQTLELSLYRECTYAVSTAARSCATGLQRLALQGCFVWPEGAMGLTRLAALTSLHISALDAQPQHSSAQLAALLMELTALQALRTLEMRLTIADAANLHALLRAVAALPRLEALFMFLHVDGGVATLCSYLTRLTALTELHITNSAWPVEHAEWEQVGDALASLTLLRALSLSRWEADGSLRPATVPHTLLTCLLQHHPRLEILVAAVSGLLSTQEQECQRAGLRIANETAFHEFCLPFFRGE